MTSAQTTQDAQGAQDLSQDWIWDFMEVPKDKNVDEMTAQEVQDFNLITSVTT